VLVGWLAIYALALLRHPQPSVLDGKTWSDRMRVDKVFIDDDFEYRRELEYARQAQERCKQDIDEIVGDLRNDPRVGAQIEGVQFSKLDRLLNLCVGMRVTIKKSNERGEAKKTLLILERYAATKRKLVAKQQPPHWTPPSTFRSTEALSE
jgi:hypothetical protein